MSSYVLDTSALLTLRGDEAGAERVAALLADANAGSITLPRLFYLADGGAVLRLEKRGGGCGA
jgi:PIN domain nuclease of toxin-antitoxin system